jgi:hypothetical protein
LSLSANRTADRERNRTRIYRYGPRWSRLRGRCATWSRSAQTPASRAGPTATVVIGGLVTSTLLTLFVLPTI